jgi:hypothetical protein
VEQSSWTSHRLIHTAATAQSCKFCHCPKCKLHEFLVPPPKYTYAQELKVLRAADGLLTVEKQPKRLFDRKWQCLDTDDCMHTSSVRAAKGGPEWHSCHAECVVGHHRLRCPALCKYVRMRMYMYVCALYMYVLQMHVHVLPEFQCMCDTRCDGCVGSATRTPCTRTIMALQCTSSKPSSKRSTSWKSTADYQRTPC